MSSTVASIHLLMDFLNIMMAQVLQLMIQSFTIIAL